MDALIEDDRSVIADSEFTHILHEFYQLSGNKSFSATYFIYRDIAYLENKIEIIELTVEKLRAGLKNDLLCKVLENYGFSFDWDKPESFARVITRTKSDAIQLQQLARQWNKKAKDEGATKDDLYTYFGSWLDALSDDAKFIIEPEKITVADFCRRMLNLQRKANKNGSRYTNRPNI
jgi:hypothetical protein